MKCKYCKKELRDGAKFCDECGAKTEFAEEKKQEEVVSPINESSQTGKFFLLVLLLVGIGFGVWYFVFRDDTKMIEEPDVVDRKNNNNNSIDDKDKDKEKTIKINKYTMTLPASFSYYSFDNTTYIENDDCIITFVEYNMTYVEMVSNKEAVLEEFKAREFDVESYETKNIEGLDCVLVVGKANNIEYGYLFTDINNETPVYFSISSSTLSKFNTNWFLYIVEMIKTARI